MKYDVEVTDSQLGCLVEALTEAYEEGDDTLIHALTEACKHKREGKKVTLNLVIE